MESMKMEACHMAEHYRENAPTAYHEKRGLMQNPPRNVFWS